MGLEFTDAQETLAQRGVNNNLDSYEVVRKIVHWDLDTVEKRADALICYWDANAGRGAGTQAEITAAFRCGKPVCAMSGA